MIGDNIDNAARQYALETGVPQEMFSEVLKAFVAGCEWMYAQNNDNNR